jgi:hypothetical protein
VRLGFYSNNLLEKEGGGHGSPAPLSDSTNKSNLSKLKNYNGSLTDNTAFLTQYLERYLKPSS